MSVDDAAGSPSGPTDEQYVPAVRIVIADDHPIFRDGLRKLLDNEDDMQIVGEVNNGNECTVMIGKLKPDILLLDLRMPEKDGLTLLEEMNFDSLPTRVIVLTATEDDRDVVRAMRLGARGVVLKLSNILRRLLRKHETFVPLREELSFIDDYLDIEVARFGDDNLDIVKEFEDGTLETFIPSMLLQPIVENSLKHGLAPKLEGGRIHLRTSNREGRLHIEIEDNGVGISEEKLPHVYVEGIGLSNVRERLRVLYGEDFLLEIESREGQGTIIKIDVPELVPVVPEVSLF